MSINNNDSTLSISTAFHQHQQPEPTHIATTDESVPPSVIHSRAPSVESVHPAALGVGSWAGKGEWAGARLRSRQPDAQEIPCIMLHSLSTSSIHAKEREKFESRRAKRNVAYFYYRFVNPWIRLLVLSVLVLYFYMVMSSFTTLRQNQFHTHLPSGMFGDPQIEYKDNPNPPITFALKDTMHENLPAAWGSSLTAWKGWANFTVAFFQIIVPLWCILTRDIIRATEYIVCLMVLFFWNGIAHVVTTYPDPAYYQYETCVNPKYHTAGQWLIWMSTLNYCGDHMWSGHTTNTLIAIIFLRRLIWDAIGWNFHYLYSGEPCTMAHQPYPLIDATGRHMHQWQWGYSTNEQKSHAHQTYTNNIINTTSATSTTTATTTTTTENSSHDMIHTDAAHRYPDVPFPDIPIHSVERISNMELGNAHLDKTIEKEDGNEDVCFRIRRSPYSSPSWVVHHRKLVLLVWTMIRLLLPPWHASLCVAILIIRFHYTADVVVANLMTVLVTCNPYFVQILVRWFYRPNYWNYQWKHWVAPVYIDHPTNHEQCNYEERVRRCGIGGLF